MLLYDSLFLLKNIFGKSIWNESIVDENTGDDASDLEPEPTVPKASTTKKVAVPKTSKKRGPRGPYKKKPKQQFLYSFLYSTTILLYRNY